MREREKYALMQRQNSPWNTFEDLDLSADVSCRCTLGEKKTICRCFFKNGKYYTERVCEMLRDRFPTVALFLLASGRTNFTPG